MRVRHTTQTAQPDNPAYDVGASEWNADHTTVGTIDVTETPYGADPTGVADATSAIQAAATAAFVAGSELVGAGIFKISSTVTIKGACDLSRAEFRTIDTAITVIQLGDQAAVTFSQVFWLPRITQQTHTLAAGWGAGVGVAAYNLNSCEVHVGRITSFGTGLLMTSAGANGNVYNDVFVGFLENNKVNIQLVPGSAAGWVNENNFYGGRCHTESAEGTNITGVRHLLIDQGTNSVNNNRFYGLSVEGAGPEFHVECYGVDNLFVGLRWETTTPKVKYSQVSAGNAALGNVVLYGYKALSIVFTYGANCFYNSVYARDGVYIEGSGSGAISGANHTSSANPTFAALQAGDRADADLARAGWGMGYLYLFGKVATDTIPRFRGAGNTGTLEWGPGGAGALDTNLYRGGAGILKTDDKLIAVIGLGVGNSAAATTPGTVTGKVEVFDAAGASLGFIAVYNAIT